MEIFLIGKTKSVKKKMREKAQKINSDEIEQNSQKHSYITNEKFFSLN